MEKKDVWMLKMHIIFYQIPCFTWVKFICWSTIYGYRIQTQKTWRSKTLILLFLVMTHWEFKFKFFIMYRFKTFDKYLYKSRKWAEGIVHIHWDFVLLIKICTCNAYAYFKVLLDFAGWKSMEDCLHAQACKQPNWMVKPQ